VKTSVKICAVPTQQDWRKMKGKKRQRKRERACDVEKAIDAIQQGAETAIKVYRVVKPVFKAMIANRRKTK
jgi:hypothetical protein